ncbi:bifunctional folylpolyglutamate synthase/dihydrofolate synthase [Elizabethkingia argentiflava]|uniref:Dihydrofolate synthase/folylpolyglutamate synthase n=1 Tax=Elizabethkingia argenteiflava TaxID=2681556 RepID=A0A845PR85_9FLAO|nr:folylpolyglutamate synthase/dihydrofolate synthase family protein [Elizabethkingia argenteiflava]NAW50712.1 bifunctional folylpolyglutamate synthase/dihydrofolate synthase [Elizabethkingia argenteiflava]
MTKQDHQKALEWLFTQIPNYQNDGIKAYKPGLENIHQLCAYFNHPQQQLKMIHIAGTNGKGSTSNMLASVLQEEGYNIGLYTSPHLIHFTERIKVNGKNADAEFVFDFIQKLRKIPQDIQASFFEFTTVMAFEYFRLKKVDFAIIEVGLGGRLDATNIISPILTAITNISLDHTQTLGNSLEEITREKAGIIKAGVPIVSGDKNPIVKDIIQHTADRVRAKFVDASLFGAELKSDLKGIYQKNNIKVVQALTEELRLQNISVSEESLTNGLLKVHQNTYFMGRWFEYTQIPLTICDTGHNQAGLEYVFEQLNSYHQHKHIVLGFVNDKNIDEVIPLLPKNEDFYFVKPSTPRGRHPREYENILQQENLKYKIFNNVQEGYLLAKENCLPGEMIFIGGSNFVVGDFLEKNLVINE